MVSGSQISGSTLRAFLETHYHVFTQPAFHLQIDQESAELAVACKLYGANCSAFITACNPRSQQVDVAENAQQQALLRRELEVRNLHFLQGEGKHPSNEWPGEASFLVFGLPRPEAGELAQRFRQDAFLWADADCIPRLVLTR